MINSIKHCPNNLKYITDIDQKLLSTVVLSVAKHNKDEILDISYLTETHKVDKLIDTLVRTVNIEYIKYAINPLESTQLFVVKEGKSEDFRNIYNPSLNTLIAYIKEKNDIMDIVDISCMFRLNKDVINSCINEIHIPLIDFYKSDLYTMDLDILEGLICNNADFNSSLVHLIRYDEKVILYKDLYKCLINKNVLYTLLVPPSIEAIDAYNDVE